MPPEDVELDPVPEVDLPEMTDEPDDEPEEWPMAARLVPPPPPPADAK